jgi:hypothetical protein
MTATSPLLQGQQFQLNDYASLTRAEMPLQWGCRSDCDDGKDACSSTTRTPLQWGQQRHHDDSKEFCALMMTKTPLQQGQQCQLEDSNDAIATRETTLSQIKGNDAIVTRAMTPAWGQQGHLRIDNGNNAIIMRPTFTIATMVKMPVHWWQ